MNLSFSGKSLEKNEEIAETHKITEVKLTGSVKCQTYSEWIWVLIIILDNSKPIEQIRTITETHTNTKFEQMVFEIWHSLMFRQNSKVTRSVKRQAYSEWHFWK